MKRRVKGVLLVASLAVAAMATAVVLPSLALTRALTRSFAQNRWVLSPGLLVGPAGVPLPVHLY